MKRLWKLINKPLYSTELNDVTIFDVIFFGIPMLALIGYSLWMLAKLAASI